MLYNYGEKLSEEECHLRASAALDSVGLGNRLRHRPNQLSGGQQQRVAIARALVNRPMLVLADEPTGNLDTQASREVLEILLGLHAQGVTLVMVTHEPEMAAQAQREIPMRDGQVLDGPLHRSDDPAEYSNSETRDPGRAQTAASSSGVLP
jgi:putative ABC transport system ATP-binding protein